MQEEKPARAFAPTWKVVIAFLFDLITAFFVIGYLVALIFGGTTERGFALEGMPALLLFVLLILYFVIGNRTGGTLWKRIFRIPVR